MIQSHMDRGVWLLAASMMVGVVSLALRSSGGAFALIGLCLSLFLGMFGAVSFALAKGQHWVWGLLGFSLIGIAVIVLLTDKTKAEARNSSKILDLSTLDAETARREWPCPKCAKKNPNTTYKCRFCGHSIV